jgi:hypothetical protein
MNDNITANGQNQTQENDNQIEQRYEYEINQTDEYDEYNSGEGENVFKDAETS